MEPGSISIVTTNGITENSLGKSKTSITLPSASRLSNATKIQTPWLKNLLNDEGSAWDVVKSSLAELIGTAILVFIGCAGCVSSLTETPSSIQVSFVFGFAVMLVIQSIGHISGAHINPAITVGAVVFGKKSLLGASLYIIAQCIGSILGYGLLKAMTPQAKLYGGDGPDSASSFCVTNLNESIHLAHGLLGEIMATGILMFMTCAIWDDRNKQNTDSTAIKFGLTVAVLCMAIGPYTGCSMNPARSLGPAIFNNYWDNHWVYWFGPIGGALIASVAYRSIFLEKDLTQSDCAVLTDKTEI